MRIGVRGGQLHSLLFGSEDQPIEKGDTFPDRNVEGLLSEFRLGHLRAEIPKENHLVRHAILRDDLAQFLEDRE